MDLRYADVQLWSGGGNWGEIRLDSKVTREVPELPSTSDPQYNSVIDTSFGTIRRRFASNPKSGVRAATGGHSGLQVGSIYLNSTYRTVREAGRIGVLLADLLECRLSGN